MKTAITFLFSLLAYIAVAQTSVPFIQADQIDAWRTADNDTTYIINFWATWCVPCVQELPDIIKLQETYADQKTRLILVSNDFRKNIDTKLIPFVEKMGIQEYTVFMNEPTPNKWIDLVNPEWSGAIPATWIVQPSSGKEVFHEGKMTYEQMEQMLRSVWNK